mmetsp:Transcript_7861/g.13902  ORF Transcript_7861/g.13902 Transcript_7861/m.13902 type:complete len:100 (+) Transcript_7861:234-533(+)
MVDYLFGAMLCSYIRVHNITKPTKHETMLVAPDSSSSATLGIRSLNFFIFYFAILDLLPLAFMPYWKNFHDLLGGIYSRFHSDLYLLGDEPNSVIYPPL